MDRSHYSTHVADCSASAGVPHDHGPICDLQLAIRNRIGRSTMADDRDNGAQLSEYLGFINRRGFLRGAAAAGVASFLAACGAAADTAQNAAGGGAAFGK